jgi:hypothetical protein
MAKRFGRQHVISDNRCRVVSVEDMVTLTLLTPMCKIPGMDGKVGRCPFDERQSEFPGELVSFHVCIYTIDDRAYQIFSRSEYGLLFCRGGALWGLELLTKPIIFARAAGSRPPSFIIRECQSPTLPFNLMME